MNSTPRPMEVVRRRPGASRGAHGTLTEPATPQPGRAEPAVLEADASGPSPTTNPQPAGRRQTDTTAASKASYDARGKIIWRGVDDETYGKLRAMYREQLRRDEGIDGWSEWGRSILQQMVVQYEASHGQLDATAHVQLRSGRPPRMPR